MTQASRPKTHPDCAPSDSASTTAATDLPLPPPDLTSPQLTLRALLTGCLLGAVLSSCSIYTGLTIGWSFNMSIPAILLSYAFWRGLQQIAGTRPWGMLENNLNQAACSAAAAVSSAGLVAPIPALTMLTGESLSWAPLSLWVFSVCMVGITCAVPIRRQMVEIDRLPFPAGLANATLLREMYAHGSEALARVRVLLGSMLVAISLLILREFPIVLQKALLPLHWLAGLDVSKWRLVRLSLPIPAAWIGGFQANTLTFSLDPSLLMIGVGGLIGLRACASLLGGSILAWLVIAPPLIHDGHIRLRVSEPLAVLPAGVVEQLAPEPRGYTSFNSAPQGRLTHRGIMSADEHARLLGLSSEPDWQSAIGKLYQRSQVGSGAANAAQPSFTDVGEWRLWPGVTLMVVSALVSFAFSWPALIRAMRFSAGSERSATEVPWSWFGAMFAGSLLLAVFCQTYYYGIAWWAALLGVLLSFVLAIVATRVSGETNNTPVGAMGKVTQLVFGAIVPASPAANLMTANVTGGAASQCADLMHDLKTGALIGASPRKQVIAQSCGALAGALAGSWFYLVLIPNPTQQLMTEQWAAPAVVTWKAVAELFRNGLEALPSGALTAMLIAAAVGVVLPVLERLLPKKAALFVPSCAGVGLAFVINAYNTVSMFIGGVLALILSQFLPKWTARFLVPLCAGLTAGEPLAGVGIAISRMPFWGNLFGG